MKQPDFNQVVDRHHTSSVKWDFMGHYLQLHETDLLPMWVSDLPACSAAGAAYACRSWRIWL